MTRSSSYTRIFAGALALAGCNRGGAQESEPQRPVAVRAAPVIQEEIVRPIIATGALGSKDELGLSFKIGGVIARIDVDAGETVPAGATLAVLDLREIDAAVARAQSAADKAERDLARAHRLYADSVVTLAQLQDAETAAQVARADLAAARFNRRYAVIVAPAKGVILRRDAEAGETVAAGAAVLRFGSHARGSVVRAGVADRDLVRIRLGDAASVRFDALPGRVYEGRVTEIAAAAEPGTGAYAVEVSVRDVAGLASGLVGTVEILPAGRTRAALVPIEAVLEADGARAIVYVLSPDSTRAERREIAVGFIDGDRVAVTAGLDGVASVLTDGAAYLDDGAAVRVIR